MSDESFRGDGCFRVLIGITVLMSLGAMLYAVRSCLP